VAEASSGDLHRIGGGSVENLRLKPQEAALMPPGISLLQAPSPGEAARQIQEAFPSSSRQVTRRHPSRRLDHGR
jgi:hypothetical protein